VGDLTRADAALLRALHCAGDRLSVLDLRYATGLAVAAQMMRGLAARGWVMEMDRGIWEVTDAGRDALAGHEAELRLKRMESELVKAVSEECAPRLTVKSMSYVRAYTRHLVNPLKAEPSAPPDWPAPILAQVRAMVEETVAAAMAGELVV
jgi:hypothetical protein